MVVEMSVYYWLIHSGSRQSYLKGTVNIYSTDTGTYSMSPAPDPRNNFGSTGSATLIFIDVGPIFSLQIPEALIHKITVSGPNKILVRMTDDYLRYQAGGHHHTRFTSVSFCLPNLGHSFFSDFPHLRPWSSNHLTLLWYLYWLLNIVTFIFNSLLLIDLGPLEFCSYHRF